jgi:hypothetical protein
MVRPRWCRSDRHEPRRQHGIRCQVCRTDHHLPPQRQDGPDVEPSVKSAGRRAEVLRRNQPHPLRQGLRPGDTSWDGVAEPDPDRGDVAVPRNMESRLSQQAAPARSSWRQCAAADPTSSPTNSSTRRTPAPRSSSLSPATTPRPARFTRRSRL